MVEQVLAHFGPQARKRFIVVATLKSLMASSGATFRWPTPKFTDADWPRLKDVMLPDDEVPDSAWGHKRNATMVPTQLMRSRCKLFTAVSIASHGPGIGFSSYANKIKHHNQACPTNLTSLGNIRVPSRDWVEGTGVEWDRKLMPTEFCGSFEACDDIIEMVERFGSSYAMCGAGVPCAFSHALFTNVTGFLRDAGVQPSTTFREDRHRLFVVSLIRQPVVLSACLL